MSNILIYRILIGRWGQLIEQKTNPNNLNNTENDLLLGNRLRCLLAYLDQEKMAEFGEVFMNGICIALIMVPTLFWSFVLFDTLGDEIGISPTYWIVVAMSSCPMMIFMLKWILLWLQHHQSYFSLLLSLNNSSATDKVETIKNKGLNHDDDNSISNSNKEIEMVDKMLEEGVLRNAINISCAQTTMNDSNNKYH